MCARVLGPRRTVQSLRCSLPSDTLNPLLGRSSRFRHIHRDGRRRVHPLADVTHTVELLEPLEQSGARILPVGRCTGGVFPSAQCPRCHGKDVEEAKERADREAAAATAEALDANGYYHTGDAARVECAIAGGAGGVSARSIFAG